MQQKTVRCTVAFHPATWKAGTGEPLSTLKCTVNLRREVGSSEVDVVITLAGKTKKFSIPWRRETPFLPSDKVARKLARQYAPELLPKGSTLKNVLAG